MSDEDSTPIQTNLNEAGILADVLRDKTGEDLLTVSTVLTPDDFTDLRNKTIYQAFLNLNQRGITPDLTTLLTELENTKELDNAGGMAYLERLVSDYYAIAPIKNYISNVQDQGLLKRFITTISRITDDAKNKPINDISEFIGKAEAEILSVTHERRVADLMDMTNVTGQIVRNLVKQTEDFKKEGRRLNGVTGINTGYSTLDQLTKGWHKGDYIVIGARPSVGKTAFCINLLYNIAANRSQPKPVVFFSLEMSAPSIGMRLLERISGLSDREINSIEFQKGSTPDRIIATPQDEEQRKNIDALSKGLRELKNLPFYIDDTPNGQLNNITAKVKKLKNAIPDLGLVAIDYLGLITSPSKQNAASRQQEVADISRKLKELARVVDVPVLVLSQLNRETEGSKSGVSHKPQLANLRDSGAVEQDADMIMMLYRPDYYASNSEGKDKVESQSAENNSPISQVSVLLEKNRNGQTGEINFSFDKPHCAFTEIENPQGMDNALPMDEPGPDETF